MNFKRTTRSSTLLHKTFRQFGICAALCFAVTAPLFYGLTKRFYAEDLMDLLEAVQRGEAVPHIDLEQDIMAGMMLQFLLIFLAITLALYLTLRLATQKLWHPFDDTLLKAEQFNLAQSDVPEFPATHIVEFDRLNRTLERLMRKDKETYRIQKEFTENASHELQTPLAIIRSKLDLLMQEDLNDKQMALVGDLYGMTMRLGHLNRNLLLLAKIENAQYADWEMVDVVAMIRDSLPHFMSLRGGAPLQLHDERHDPAFRLRANPVLLDCLLKNLIVNAIRHSDADGKICVQVNEERLSVSNEASDGPLNADTLFLRFHSNDAKRKGNGLGLAIVKAICDFHHWTIDYRYGAGRHTFVVVF